MNRKESDMEIQRKSDDKVFKVYSAVRDVQEMPAMGWAETVTWFLIWEDNTWWWVKGAQYVPYEEPAHMGMF
jgi:hypothetical protein